MGEGHPLISMVVCLIMLLMLAAFNGMEVAVSATSENELEQSAEEGNKKAGRILRLLKKPVQLKNAIQIITGTFMILCGVVIVRPYGRSFGRMLTMKFALDTDVAYGIGYVVMLIMMVYVLLVFGVIFPKRLAYKYAKAWTFNTIGIVLPFIMILRPFTALITLTVNGLVRLVGINPKDIEENVTEEEIIMMVSEGHEQGVIEASEAEMIHNILEFDDKNASDIMVHRRHITGIDVNLSLKQAAKIMAEGSYSRYPVYEEDEDNIIGILHLKDVMRRIVDNRYDLSIRDLMHEPRFVPATQSINKLFENMQSSKVHMVIVVDEYGQSCGLVAMEDILEEIVGNIMDEYDQDQSYITSMGDAWYMSGLTPLEEISERLGIDFDDEFDTLNGLIISSLDQIPKSDEHACITYGGYDFSVISVNDNRISRVRVTKSIKKNEDEEPEKAQKDN